MITDEKHAELRNLMTPIVNYFAMLQSKDKVTKSTLHQFNALIDKECEKIINVNLPKVREILSNERETVRKHCVAYIIFWLLF
jgi:ATP-dependent Zn protease